MKVATKGVIASVLAVMTILVAQELCRAVDVGCCEYDAPQALCQGDGYDCDGCTILGDCGEGKLIKHGGVNICVGTSPHACTRPETKTACYTYYECDITTLQPLSQCVWLGVWWCAPGIPNIWCPKCGPVGSGLTAKEFDYTCQDD